MEFVKVQNKSNFWPDSAHSGDFKFLVEESALGSRSLDNTALSGQAR